MSDVPQTPYSSAGCSEHNKLTVGDAIKLLEAGNARQAQILGMACDEWCADRSELLKKYADFVTHQTRHWMRGLPGVWRTRSELSGAKRAIKALTELEAVVSDIGTPNCRNLVARLNSVCKNCALDEEVERRASLEPGTAAVDPGASAVDPGASAVDPGTAAVDPGADGYASGDIDTCAHVPDGSACETEDEEELLRWRDACLVTAEGSELHKPLQVLLGTGAGVRESRDVLVEILLELSCVEGPAFHRIVKMIAANEVI